MAIVNVFVIMAALTAMVKCYPSGTGIDSACSNMTPKHGVSPMNFTSPYYVFADTQYYKPGQSVKVTIGSYNSTFKGFMIQARRANPSEDQTEMLGNFTVVSNTNAACSWHALVHSDSSSKTNLTFTWNPPSDSSGDIVFRVTFVQSKMVLWTDVQSETVYDVSNMQTSTTAPTMYSDPSVIYKYNYCGLYEGCFSDCNANGCSFFVSWYVSDDMVHFTLRSSFPAPAFYMALGFSEDNEMGDDSVIGCVHQNNEMYKFSGENVDHNGPVLFSNYKVQLKDASFYNDILTCHITLWIDSLGKRYDLNNSWTLFFAKGFAKVVNDNITLYYHQSEKYISKNMVSAYSKADLDPMPTDENDDDDNVIADSAESLVQTGSMKVLFIFAFVICYLAKLRF